MTVLKNLLHGLKKLAQRLGKIQAYGGIIMMISAKKSGFYFGSFLLLLVLVTATAVYAVEPYVEPIYEPEEIVEPELVFANLVGNLPILDMPFYDGDFVLSAPPGVHEQAFDLTVLIPSIPDAVIYFTIDGNDPMPGEDRFVTRGDRIIQLSGRLPADGMIGVHDRSGYWGNAILTYHSRYWSYRDTLPANDAEILQGTAFCFRGFVNGEPVTEIITATYIIAQNANARFANRPIIAVTAPYEDFLYIYSHANRNDITRRRIFNYEYFELGEAEYSRIFSLLGSSSLGGWGSRPYAQRTINVHFARGRLDGVITHPIFEGLYELYRFRLWNGGQTFFWDHMRDPFAQTASAMLNVRHSDDNLAIKFINGEYWGFTTMREHNSNAQFVNTRFGLKQDNVAMVTNLWSINEGSEGEVRALIRHLTEFTNSYDMSTDHARERLFTEFFCLYNFMDYVISNTFFGNADWPFNNMRMFRAITPNPNSLNPYEDGRWRFIFHDMDWAPRSGDRRYADSNFSFLYEHFRELPHGGHGNRNNSHFQVFNNQVFVEQFIERANYVLENYYSQEQLLALHDEFSMRYMPLLPEMYNRFAIGGGG